MFNNIGTVPYLTAPLPQQRYEYTYIFQQRINKNPFSYLLAHAHTYA